MRQGKEIVDLGCGSKKTPGAWGVDCFPYAGVDQVHDLESHPWPLAADRFDRVICRHILEHVADPVAFLAEVHRIGRDGAIVEFYTPHFSSVNSWLDPTHRRHLSVEWCQPFLAGGYLAARTGLFEQLSSVPTFSKSSLMGLLTRGLVAVCGLRRWEKYLAFRWPARDIETQLRIVKQPVPQA